jgi:hypothetical protein
MKAGSANHLLVERLVLLMTKPQLYGPKPAA